MRDLPYAEQWIQIIGLIAAIVAGLLSRPFPLEHEADPANPPLAARGKPYRWGAYLATLILAAAGSIELFRRSWRGVFMFFAWRLFFGSYGMLAVRSQAVSAPCLFSGILTIWLSAVYFRQRKSLILRSG